MAEQSSDLLVIKKETADIVLSKVQHFQKNGELDLPPNYSAPNALKSAWLILQETLDKDKRLALTVCTKPSIANALLDMVVQGLNPAKNQCYFVVYGQKLTLMRSYLGSKAVCLRVNKELEDVYSEVVYEGDTLEYEIKNGRRVIVEHKQKLSNIDDSKILAAYAVALGKDGEVKRSELMTMDQIKQAWKQSKMKPINDDGSIKPGSTHGKFAAELCKRTVTNRLSKHIIGASSDADLVIQSVKRTDEHAVEAEAEAEVEEFANQGEVVDIDPGNGDQEPELPDEAQADNTPSEKEQLEIHAREMSEAGTAYTPTNQEKVNDQGMDSDHAAGRGPGF